MTIYNNKNKTKKLKFFMKDFEMEYKYVSYGAGSIRQRCNPTVRNLQRNTGQARAPEDPEPEGKRER